MAGQVLPGNCGAGYCQVCDYVTCITDYLDKSISSSLISHIVSEGIFSFSIKTDCNNLLLFVTIQLQLLALWYNFSNVVNFSVAYVLIADILWMFRAFRIGFTITGRNYSDKLQDVSSREYKTTAAEIFAQVSLFEAVGR